MPLALYAASSIWRRWRCERGPIGATRGRRRSVPSETALTDAGSGRRGSASELVQLSPLICGTTQAEALQAGFFDCGQVARRRSGRAPYGEPMAVSLLPRAVPADQRLWQ
jgi:hypothetical protein